MSLQNDLRVAVQKHIDDAKKFLEFAHDVLHNHNVAQDVRINASIDATRAAMKLLDRAEFMRRGIK